MRELDAQIAEKVMRLKIRLGSPTLPELRIEGGWKAPDDWLLLNDDGSVKQGIALPGGPVRLTVPHYSTNISAAMKAVEKMRADGWSFACTLYEGKLPYASFCKGTAASSRNAEADSLPEAICKAALSAIES